MEPEPAAEDRRRFQRLTLGGSARLYASGGYWDTQLIDMSLKGVLVVRPSGCDPAPGTRFRMELRVHDALVISMGVEAARVEPQRIALAWDRIDLDSLARLKRVIELNIAEPDLLNRELAGLG